MSAERTMVRISTQQLGSASRHQLLENGVADHTIDRRLTAGLWVPVAPAVYRLAGRPPDWRMRAAAAWLEAHREAVFAGWTALALQGGPVPENLL